MHIMHCCWKCSKHSDAMLQQALKMKFQESKILGGFSLQSFLACESFTGMQCTSSRTCLCVNWWCCLKMCTSNFDAGVIDPEYHMTNFTDRAGPSLATVTCLDLHLKGTTDILPATALLLKATSALLHAVPRLQKLCCSQGRLSSDFLKKLGESCPLLETLEFVVCRDEPSVYMQEIAFAQPSLIPQLRTMVIQANQRNTCKPCDGPYSLPNMVENTSLHNLELRGYHSFENSTGPAFLQGSDLSTVMKSTSFHAINLKEKYYFLSWNHWQ